MKCYVGNLNFDTSEEELRQLFAQFGQVNEANIIQDRETGRPRGFGFVTMNDRDSAEKAIGGLDGTDFKGRNIKVNEAKERPKN